MALRSFAALKREEARRFMSLLPPRELVYAAQKYYRIPAQGSDGRSCRPDERTV